MAELYCFNTEKNKRLIPEADRRYLRQLFDYLEQDIVYTMGNLYKIQCDLLDPLLPIDEKNALTEKEMIQAAYCGIYHECALWLLPFQPPDYDIKGDLYILFQEVQRPGCDDPIEDARTQKNANMADQYAHFIKPYGSATDAWRACVTGSIHRLGTDEDYQRRIFCHDPVIFRDAINKRLNILSAQLIYRTPQFFAAQPENWDQTYPGTLHPLDPGHRPT